MNENGYFTEVEKIQKKIWLFFLLIVFLCEWVFGYVLVYGEHRLYALLQHYLPRYGATVILTPLTYFFNRAFFLRLRSSED